MIEVELKFPVESLEAIRAKFQAAGATAHLVSVQSDEYLNDPLRDYSKLDIALRIRSTDGRYYLTYKGPLLDQQASARFELAVPLEGKGDAGRLSLIFKRMGLNSVAKVVKRRETMTINWQGANIEVCLDEVEEVGPFVELELLVEEDQHKMESAKQKLLSLAKEVGLTGSIQTSYLELLLKKRGDI